MPISDRRKRLIAPRLFDLFDEKHVRKAEYDFEALNLQHAVEGEIRKQVEEIYIPLKMKEWGTRCEVCGWPAPDRSYMVLHHQKKAPFSGMFLQVYGSREGWDLRDQQQRDYIVRQVVALHRLEHLSWVDKACHCLRCHPENRQLNTRCSGHVQEIQRLQAQQGFTCREPDYGKT